MKKHYPRYYSVALLLTCSFMMMGCGALLRGCARYGDDVVRYGDDVVKYGDDAVKYGDDALKYGDEAAGLGPDALKYGDDLNKIREAAGAMQGQNNMYGTDARMMHQDLMDRQEPGVNLCQAAVTVTDNYLMVKHMPDQKEAECLMDKGALCAYNYIRAKFQGPTRFAVVMVINYKDVNDAARQYGLTTTQATELIQLTEEMGSMVKRLASADEMVFAETILTRAGITPVFIYPEADSKLTGNLRLINNLIPCGKADNTTNALDVFGVLKAVKNFTIREKLVGFYIAFARSYNSYIMEQQKTKCLIYTGPTVNGKQTVTKAYYSSKHL